MIMMELRLTLVPLYVADGCTIEKISNHFIIIIVQNIYVIIDFLQKMYGIMFTEYFCPQLSDAILLHF